MRKSFLFASILGTALFFTHAAYADSVHYATPTNLQVTVKKFELCTDAACSRTALLGNGDAVFDIASASSGASIGDYAANASIPRGVRFTHARLTISRTFTISGAASVPNVGAGANPPAAACFTKTGNPISGLSETTSASATASINLAAAQAAATPQTIFLAEGEAPPSEVLISEVYTANDVIGVYRLPTPMELSPTSTAPQITISIDAANAMSFYADGTDCYADEEPPVISIGVTQ